MVSTLITVRVWDFITIFTTLGHCIPATTIKKNLGSSNIVNTFKLRTVWIYD